MSGPVCVVIGVGPGNGLACVKKFVAEGYQVAMGARNETYLNELAAGIEQAHAYPYDVTDVDAAAGVFARIRQDLGPVAVLVYNAGPGDFVNIDNTSVAMLQQAWEINTRGLFVTTQEVLPDMRAAGGGNIVVIGATASLRGGANAAPFASAKAAQRTLSQSMARHLGPEKIHVSYVIVDGIIDIDYIRKMMPEQPDEFFLPPDQIAESVYFLTQQSQGAWTFELDVRPFGEKW
jgi:NAD(P)-dependent dehydrogenase (short-subunit alcohol dehydrogenase family)